MDMSAEQRSERGLHSRLAPEDLKGIDKTVGAQVRLRRITLGLSQEEVSGRMALTFQQLQKYEHGANRISASRLYQLAAILQVPVSFFFTGLAEPATAHDGVGSGESPSLESGVMKRRRTIELVRTFYAIDDRRQRDAALKFLKTLGAAATS